MPERNHPIYFILFAMVIGGLGLGYCQLAYANGADVPKDTALIALITAATGAWFKFTGGEIKP